MNMKKISIFSLIALIVFFALYFLFTRDSVDVDIEDVREPVAEGYEEYTDEKVGLTFEYRIAPNGYTLVENDEQMNENLSLTLMNTEEYEELLASEDPREGPTAISIQVFDRSPQTALLEWLESTDASNYELGDGDISPEEISGVTGFSYRWSGLYEGRSVALPYADNVVIISVTYMTPEDVIIDDYNDLLDSFELTDSSKISFETETCAAKVAGMFPEEALETAVYSGEVAEVDFDSYPPARAFETQIKESVAGGANYAGHFNVAVWGCGTNCQGAAIIDVQDGVILPEAFVAEYDFSYSPRSLLLVSNPPENFSSMNEDVRIQTASRVEREYFVLEEQDENVRLNRVCIENAIKGVI